MIFAFREKKIMALLLLVVAFGATFGASLIKSQLEVCHLLEGTQDDLATRNSSSAEAENLKVEAGFRDDLNYSKLGDSFGDKNVDKLNLSYFHSRDRYFPHNVSHTVPFLIGALGKACGSSLMFTVKSLRDFCVNWDRVYTRCLIGQCDIITPDLTENQWRDVLDWGHEIVLDTLIVDVIPDNSTWNIQPRQIDDIILNWSLAQVFDDLRRKLFGGLNFGSYDTILSIALYLFVGIIFILGITHWFKHEYPSTANRFFELDVQARETTQEEVWKKMLRRVVPGNDVVFSKKRVNKNYRVVAVVTMKAGKIRYTCDSKESYDHAYLHLALRWPKKESDFVIQGLLRASGIRETSALKFLKCTFFFVYAYWRSRNLTDKIVAVTHWIDEILDIGFARGIDIRLIDFYTLYKRLPVIKDGLSSSDTDKPSGNRMRVEVDFDSSDDEEIPIKTDFGSGIDVQGIDDFASLLNSFLKGVFNSSSIKACFRLVSLLWHLLFVFKDGKVDWEHLNRWDSAMFSSIPERALNIGNTLLEQISNLATCSWEFYQTGDPNVFLRNDNEVSSFLEAVEKLTSEVKNVPIEPKLNASMTDLEMRIHNLILKGENLRPKVKASLRGSFTTGLLQLRSLALDVMTLARASSTRAAPFTLLITGAPKIGKSSITSLIFRQFQMSNPYNTILGNGLTLHDNGVYTRTLKEEYWSCYMNSYWGILYDDLGQTNPKCPEFALEINEIIQVVNNVMFFPQMAGVDEKGRRYVAPQIVLATSNNKDINAHHAVRSPGAVLRRFPYVITPTLRSAFATDGAIDGKKAGDNMDLWTFTIEEVIIRNRGASVTYRTIHQDISTAEFLCWVNDASFEHYRGQANGDNYQKKVSGSSLCKKCRVLSCFCTCKTDLVVNDPADHPKSDDSSAPIDVDVAASAFAAFMNRPSSQDEAPETPIDDVESDDPPSSENFEFADITHARTIFRESSEIQPDDEAVSALQRSARRQKKSKKQPWGSKIKRDFGDNCKPQFHTSSARSYTGSAFILFSAVQMGLLGALLTRMSNEPTKWFWRLYTQKAVVDTFGHNFALGFVGEQNSYRALFWRFMNNFYQFDAVDSALLMWLNGWDAASSWVQQSTIKVKNAIVKNPKIIAAIAIIITSGMFLAWYAKCAGAWSFELQGTGEIPTGSEPPPAEANIENTWKTSQKLGFTAFLSDQSKSGDVDWFEKQMHTATAHLKFNKIECAITAFNVFGNYWLLPKHFVQNKNFRMSTHVTVTRFNGISGMGSYYGVFDMGTLKIDPNSDFAILRLHTPPGANLISYLAKAPMGTMLKAVSIFMREDGIVPVIADPIKFGESAFPEVSIVNGMDQSHKYRAGYYSHPFVSVNGDCGSPMYVKEKGKLAVVGFHVGAWNSDPFKKCVMSVPVDWIKSVFEGEETCVVQGSLDTEKLDGKKIELDADIHPKCPLRFPGLADLPAGNSAIPIGAFKSLPMNHFATKVKENAFAAFWKSYGYVSNKVRPVLSTVGVGSWMPKRNFLLNACMHKDLIPSAMLNACADHFLNSFRSKVGANSIKSCVIINEETNLYGADNNNFISHMKFDTGAGFPHNKPKHMVLDRVDHPKFPDGTCAIPAAMRMKIERMEKTASNGERINVVFNSSLKDEPISQKKLESGKIRVFQAICIEGLFLLRKYFLSLIALFQTWNFASEAAIGMDTTGPDWDDLHDHIFIDGWKVFCGDYSNYDQRMGSSIMMKAWEIMITLAKMSGNYGPVAIKIMWVLATECCYSMVNFFGDLLCLNGSNPSGHGLTVVINSICNSIYVRVAWHDIFGNLDDFSAHVRLMTYGDDNIISVHPLYQNRFNQVTVTESLAKYGIVYTDAMKTGESAKPFCDNHEISFLKRSWVRSPHGFWCAPLEVASIHKMLIIGVDSGKTQEKDRLASILQASVLEAFHHGEEFFEKHRDLVIKCADEYDLHGWMKGGIPTFQELLEKRLAKVSRLSLLRGAH